MENLLPYDGIVYYDNAIFSIEESNDFFNLLLQNIEWKNDEAVVYGKHIITKRKAAWYGDKAYSYKYSGIRKEALPWTKSLLLLKQKAEVKTGETYNSCLLNLYHNGDEGMGWHSDNESTLQTKAAIASFSFGAERKFAFKHKKTGEIVSLILENGSLLLMKDTTQIHWLHSLPKTKKISGARINLTFRSMAE